MTSRPGDQPAREKALDPRRSVIVQAPAGSGKTELLTRRYLTLLALVDAPEEILAITFTRKAAAEMRERVLKALSEPTLEDPPASTRRTEAARLARARVAKMGWELTANPARLRILTIDGLNAHLVGRMPYFSGHSPRFGVSPDGGELYERAAQLALEHLEAEEDPYADALAKVLVHLDNRAAKLAAYLVKFLGKRDQWLRRRPSGKSEATLRREMEKELVALIDRRLRAACLALAPHLGEMAALAAYAASNLPEGSRLTPRLPPTPPEPIAAQAGQWRALAAYFLTSEGQPRKPGGVSKTIGFPAGNDGGMKARMKAVLEKLGEDEEAARALATVRELPDPGYSDEEWALVAPVLAVYDLAAGCLKVAMEESGSTDFTEIGLRALSALGSEGEPTDLTLALDHKLKHLLVDEFQDTSRTQYDLLEKLTEGWVPGDGRTLFLVGDPMQSIYRFREADVALFARAREEGLGPVRPAKARLTANFRSKAGLVEYFNDLFPRIFPLVDDRSAGGVAYSPADAPLEDEGGERVAFYPLSTDDREEEARLVADEVEAALAKNPLGTVGILLRARTHAPALVEELKRRGIPFRGERLDPLNESLAVLDVITLARALADRSDRLSWLGVLRAPWCGLTLAECRSLVGGLSDPLPKLVGDAVAQNLLDGTGGESLARFWRAMEPALAQVGRRPFGQLVEGVWAALGAPGYLDQRGYADATQALALLNTHCPGHLPNLAGLQEKIQKLYSSPDPDGGPVTIMTIHNAKGLQFNTVILPGLGRATGKDELDLITWEESATGGLVVGVAPPVKEGAGKGVAHFLEKLEKEREANERRRLLYVAVTRAMERLVMIGHAKYSEKKHAFGPVRGSLIETLWPATAERFSEPPGETHTGERTERPQPPVFALPPSWTPPAVENPPLEARAGEVEGEKEEERVFDWAREVRKHIGTVAHSLLERLGVEGLDAWSAERVDQRFGAIKARLAALGVAAEHLEEAAQEVARAAKTVLADENARALLAPGEGAASEYAVTSVVDGEPRTRRIDRTYLDAEGVRWIVDFKLSTHEGGGLEEFLKLEEGRHREQLTSYAAIMKLLEPGRTVRAALYYPLLGRLVEVEVD